MTRESILLAAGWIRCWEVLNTCKHIRFGSFDKGSCVNCGDKGER